MKLPKVNYNVGESFLMTLYLPPDLQAEHNKQTMIVEAKYIGIWTNKKISESNIGILAMGSGLPSHHIVEYNGKIYVNDLCGGFQKISDLKQTIVDVAKELSYTEDGKAPEELPDGPRPSVRSLKRNNEWNIEGLKEARIVGDGPIVVCEVTGDELYYVQDDGKQINLRSHGVCTHCNRMVGEKVMNNFSNSCSSWPVVFIGAYCNECSPKYESNDSEYE